jgi:hypothetical protein
LSSSPFSDIYNDPISFASVDHADLAIIDSLE